MLAVEMPWCEFVHFSRKNPLSVYIDKLSTFLFFFPFEPDIYSPCFVQSLSHV